MNREWLEPAVALASRPLLQASLRLRGPGSSRAQEALSRRLEGSGKRRGEGAFLKGFDGASS